MQLIAILLVQMVVNVWSQMSVNVWVYGQEIIVMKVNLIQYAIYMP